MKNLIIIPTYNEAESLPTLLSALWVHLSQSGSTSHTVEVLVVDDGSPDGTGQIAERLAATEKRLHVLHREKKQGLGPAYIAGFQWGLRQGFDRLIEMDADFSHHPRYLPRMLELLGSFDFVIGSRYVPGGGTVNWGWVRKLISRGGSLYSRGILGVPIRDFTGGFNGWNRRVLEALDLGSLSSDGYSFQIELKYRSVKKGFHFTEFPIVFEDRKVGRSKMNQRIVFEALARVWEFRFGS